MHTHDDPTYDILQSKLPYCTAVVKEALRLYPPAPVTVRTLKQPLTLHLDLSQDTAGHVHPTRTQAKAAQTTQSSSKSGPGPSMKETERKTQKQAVTLPAGTTLYIPIWWLHRSTQNYDNPEEFDPDRFYDPARASKIHRYAHVAFSGGARDCVGRRFALLETVAVFAICLRRLKFTPVEGYVLEPEAVGVVQKPKGDMPMKVEPRF